MKTLTNGTRGMAAAAMALIAGWGAGCASAPEKPAATAASETGPAGPQGVDAVLVKRAFYEPWYEPTAIVLPPPETAPAAARSAKQP